MSIFAYYQPRIAKPINDQRAGTIRVGFDDPQPIQVTQGFANSLTFGFRDETQKAWFMAGQTVTAEFYDRNGVKLLEKAFDESTEVGLATVVLTETDTQIFEAGLYSLVITYLNQQQRKESVLTVRSLPRFVIEIIDFSSN